MAKITLIIPNGPDEKPVADLVYCSQKLIIFFEQHHFTCHPTIVDNEFEIHHQFCDFEKCLYEGMFVFYGKGKVDGKKRLHSLVSIKIT